MNQSPQRERKHSEFSKISTFGNFVLFGKFANFVVCDYITYENYYSFLLKNGNNFAHNTIIYKIPQRSRATSYPGHFTSHVSENVQYLASASHMTP